jgi:hypothetical protein
MSKIWWIVVNGERFEGISARALARVTRLAFRHDLECTYGIAGVASFTQPTFSEMMDRLAAA